jgi:hypothetical protein
VGSKRTKPTRFPENYQEAALRHWHDAEFLKGERIAAADHHVGIAAECAIKHAITYASGAPLPSNAKCHMDCLWEKVSGLVDAARFPETVARLGGTSPFANWQIDDRYAATTALEADLETLDGGVSRRQARRDATAAILREAGLKP